MADMEELDDEEKARRRKEQIEWRNKKRFSNIFMICATLFEIAETFIIIIALVVIALMIMTKTMTPGSAAFSNVLGAAMIILSLGGLVIGFIIYKKVMGWVIKKYNLEDKLLDEIKMHYVKNSKNEIEEELKK